MIAKFILKLNKMDRKAQALAVLKNYCFESEICIVNKNLIIINGSKYSLCAETQYYIVQDDTHRIIFDARGLALQKAFHIMRGNLQSNL